MRKRWKTGKRIRRGGAAGAVLFLLFLSFCVLPRGSRRQGPGGSGDRASAGGKEHTPPGGKEKTSSRGKAGVPSGDPAFCALLDAGGRPLAGLPLAVWAGGEAFPGKSDEQGRFPWPGSMKGGRSGLWWGLEVFLPRGPAEAFLLRRPLPERLEVAPLLERLEGRILQEVRSRPVPLPGATITFLEIPGERILGSTRSGGEGEWVFHLPRKMPRERVLLRANTRDGGFLGSWFLGNLEGVEILLLSRKLPVRVEFRPGPPPKGASLLAAPRFSWVGVPFETPCGGRNSVRADLVPGLWQFLLLGPEGVPLGAGEVTAGGRGTRLEVPCFSFRKTLLEGRVLGPEGNPLEGVRVSFLPTSLGEGGPSLPSEGEWNPFLAARAAVKGETGRDGRFRLVAGSPWKGLLKLVFGPLRAQKVVPLALPWEGERTFRLEEGVPVDLADLDFRGRGRGGVLRGVLRWVLERPGRGKRAEGRIRFLPLRLGYFQPGPWKLLLLGPAGRGERDFLLEPDRPARLAPRLR